MTKQWRRAVCAFLAAGMMLSVGCGPAKTEEGGTEQDIRPSRVSYNENPTTEDDFYNNSLIVSLDSMGNTYRLKRVLEKARAGEEITIAYLGGSIMHGDNEDCFRGISYRYIAQTFCPGGTDQCHMINAGGGGSYIGVTRYEEDVGQYDPDLVFIGYACNNGAGTREEDAYESLLRDCLTDEKAPAVILVIGAMIPWSAGYWMEQYGYYYDLPIINYGNAFKYMFNYGGKTWYDYTFDGIHPGEEGSIVIADYIQYFLEEVDRLPGSESDRELPAPITNCTLEGLKPLNNTTYTPQSLGSWEAGSSFEYCATGWSKPLGSGNEPIVFSFTADSATLLLSRDKEIPTGFFHVFATFNGVTVYDADYEPDGSEKGASIVNVYTADKAGEFYIEISASDDDPSCALAMHSVVYSE